MYWLSIFFFQSYPQTDVVNQWCRKRDNTSWFVVCCFPSWLTNVTCQLKVIWSKPSAGWLSIFFFFFCCCRDCFWYSFFSFLQFFSCPPPHAHKITQIFTPSTWWRYILASGEQPHTSAPKKEERKMMTPEPSKLSKKQMGPEFLLGSN